MLRNVIVRMPGSRSLLRVVPNAPPSSAFLSATSNGAAARALSATHPSLAATSSVSQRVGTRASSSKAAVLESLDAESPSLQSQRGIAVAVVLSGSGYADGSEITEAVSSLIHLTANGCVYFANACHSCLIRVAAFDHVVMTTSSSSYVVISGHRPLILLSLFFPSILSSYIFL